MDQARPTIISRLNPAVPRHYLLAISGALWTLAGLLLCIRATIWLNTFSLLVEVVLEAVCVGIAVAAYSFVFFKVVQRNIDRIGRLPERACLFAFTSWQGYVMIGLMMTIGITLRNSSVPKYYLSIPYDAMGVILLIGSLKFYRRFLATAVQRQAYR
jgi:hypothetical protein